MTLTEASATTKKAVVIFGIVAVVYYIFLLLFFPGAKALFKAIFPEKDPPNPVFGMLPPLEFTEKSTKGDFNPSFKLDTNNGKLPVDLPEKMTVYEVKKTVPSFEKGKDAISTAAALGYTDDDLVTSLKEPVYKWRKLLSNGILEIDTDNRHISMSTVLRGKSEYFPRGELTKQSAINYARDIFKTIGRFEDPLYKDGTQTAVLGQFTGAQPVETQTEADAQIAKVDFYRSINEFPILGPDPKVGMLYTVLRKPQKETIYYNFPVMESWYWEISPQSDASYQIINVADAWNFVKQNKGVVVSIVPENSSPFESYTPVLVEEVFINNIYLAYYDNYYYQPYLQPIYVFEGTYTTIGTQGGTITFYYPAISPEYIKAN